MFHGQESSASLVGILEAAYPFVPELQGPSNGPTGLLLSGRQAHFSPLPVQRASSRCTLAIYMHIIA